MKATACAILTGLLSTLGHAEPQLLWKFDAGG